MKFFRWLRKLPLHWHRVLLLLFGVSALLVATDELAKLLSSDSTLLSGLVFGAVIYISTMNGGPIVRFCINNEVKESLAKNGVSQLINQWSDGRRIEVSVVEMDDMRSALVGERHGYRLFISTGALTHLSPMGTAGVLAHEAGHVRRRHCERICILLGTIGASKIAFDIPPIGIIVILMTYLYLSRQREFAADATGAELVGKDAMLAAFNEHRRATNEADISSFTEVFVTHPSLHRRIAAVQAMPQRTLGQ